MWRRFNSAKKSPIPSSIALEIIGADGMAQIRPAARPIIVDKAGVPKISLEPLGLAQRGMQGMPQRSKEDSEVRLNIALGCLKGSVGCSDVRVNEVQFGFQNGQRFGEIRLGG